MMARRVRKKKTLPGPSQKQSYNTELFPNPRAVRRALKRLGYKVNLVNTAVPSGIARQFQKDFNLCVMNKHVHGEVLKIDRIMGPRSLRALEMALAFAQKASAQKGVSTEQFWQNLCRAMIPKRPKPGPVGKGKFFVELLGNGVGRLRRADGTLRVRVQELARKGNLLFAKITIPKQDKHPGDSNPRWAPAIAR